jgi:hypothetical protein
MRKQRGVTMIGWIFLLVPVAIVFFALLRVGPEYYGYYKLVQAMKGVATKMQADPSADPKSIRKSLSLRFDTDYVDVVTADQVEVTRAEGGWTMRANYEKVVGMFGNMSILLTFDKSVPVSVAAAD